MSTSEAVEVREAAVAAEQSAMPKHIEHIRAIYIGATGASNILSGWASVYVHRGLLDLPRGHTGVSTASLARAQRAQVALLAREVTHGNA